MAQVTQGLVDEFKRHIDAKHQPPYTLNEFGQLLNAWEELQRLRNLHKRVYLVATGDTSESGLETYTRHEDAPPPLCDTERFEWFFGVNDKTAWMDTYIQGVKEKWTVDQWRAAIDSAIQWIDDPHDIEQGKMLNPLWRDAQTASAIPQATGCK